MSGNNLSLYIGELNSGSLDHTRGFRAIVNDLHYRGFVELVYADRCKTTEAVVTLGGLALVRYKLGNRSWDIPGMNTSDSDDVNQEVGRFACSREDFVASSDSLREGTAGLLLYYYTRHHAEENEAEKLAKTYTLYPAPPERDE